MYMKIFVKQLKRVVSVIIKVIFMSGDWILIMYKSSVTSVYREKNIPMIALQI